MTTQEKKLRTITATDVANYVVCPEAWRLKFFGIGRKRNTKTEVHGLRQNWVKQQDLSTQLRFYTKVAYALLVAIVVVIFLLDSKFLGHFKHSNQPHVQQQPKQ